MTSHKMDIDTIMTGKPKSLRDKLKAVLDTILDMSKETGMVEKSTLLETLDVKFNIAPAEVERLLGQMLKEGTVYSPRDGYLKKT
jgi:replicative DNA helicase Mcm